MVTRADIKAAIDLRITNVLDTAEAALPPERFKAFRRVVLRAFGDRGLTADLINCSAGRLSGMERIGMGRNDPGRKGGAP